MKTIKLFFVLVSSVLLFSSCYTEEHHNYIDEVDAEYVVTNYDIWYVDFERTTGYGEVPFVSKAFTFSFQNGRMYANTNIVGLGFIGPDGIGKQTGTYETYGDMITLHDSDEGSYEFEVIVDNPHSIRLYNAYEDVTYFLEGYTAGSFDFDQVFYDNLEYFLQEYEIWAKTFVSEEGEINDFDYENYLAFTPENVTTFYSSLDEVDIPLEDIIWDFDGDYEVLNINGYDDIKELRLYYSGGSKEEFELSVIDDETISLYHYDSGTTYEFTGIFNIEYKSQSSTESSDKKRFKVNRKSTDRKAHKTNVNKKASLDSYTPTRGR